MAVDGTESEDASPTPPWGLALIGLIFAGVFLNNQPLTGDLSYVNFVIIGISGLVVSYVALAFYVIHRNHGFRVALDWFSTPGAHPDDIPDMEIKPQTTVDTEPLEDAPTIEELQRTYDGLEFERYLAKLWSKIGYNAAVTPPTRDGGYDIEATRPKLGKNDPERVLIEAKNHHKQLSISEVQRYTAVFDGEDADRFVIVCTGGFSKPAWEWSKKRQRLELVGPDELRELRNEVH